MSDITRTAYIVNSDGELVGPHTTDNPPTILPGPLGSDVPVSPVRPYTARSTSAHLPLRDLEPFWYPFQQEVIQSATADHAAIVDKWVRVGRAKYDGLTTAQTAALRTKLQAWVTDYVAWI